MSDTKLEVETGIIRKTQHLSIWLISLLVMALGFYLTLINFCDLEWFSRSGCVVVMLGIWSGLGGIIEEHVLISKLDIQRRITISRAKIKLRKISAIEEYVEKELESIEEEHERKVEDLRNKFRLQLGILEVSLLMTGTFIWGFGDLAFKLAF